MKIDIVSFTGFDSLSGSNLRLFHFCNELISRGHELKFITPGENDAVSCRKRFNTEAESVDLDIKRFNKSRLKRYPIFAMRAAKRIENPDIVFGQSLPSALAVRRARSSAVKVIDYVDLWSEYWLHAHHGIKGRMVYQAIKRGESHSMKVDSIFTITEELKRMLMKRGADPKKINIVRDGVDIEMFRQMKTPKTFFDKYSLDAGTDYLIYQGGIGSHDGVQFLVDAAPNVLEHNPDTRFLIVGDGDYLPEIRAQVRKSGLEKEFTFTGWVPYNDMPHFMNLAKLNVVPISNSPATRGVVTLKLFEAMACGTPSVIGDLPGVRENVTHKETAYLAVSENRESLASGITDIINNQNLYAKIKENGLGIVGHHDWRMIASEMADVLENINTKE
jgi:glycosyltransferase involved in cell wall biosynthesis